MEISGVVFNTLIEMFIVVIFGYIVVRTGIINMDASERIADMLVKFIVPLTIILSFQQPFDSEQLAGIGAAFLGAVIIFIIRISFAHLAFRNSDKIVRYTMIFSNSVFVGIPVVFPILGYEGVLYLSMYIILSETLQFTYGIWTLTEDSSRMSLKNIMVNPGVIATVIGLLLYLLRIQFPTVIFNGLDRIASLSAPLGMMLLGSYLARSELVQIFNSWKNYFYMFVRLIILPLLCILGLWLLPINNPTILLTLVIVSTAPIAVNTAVFSQIYGGDYKYAARLVVLSSILCIITMPIVITLGSIILNISL